VDPAVEPALRDGSELTPKNVRMWIMKAERKAGLPDTGRALIFRHTFCSHLAMAAYRP
jgi:site-specific recombinase XerD